jgi:hypothetical protein
MYTFFGPNDLISLYEKFDTKKVFEILIEPWGKEIGLSFSSTGYNPPPPKGCLFILMDTCLLGVATGGLQWIC